MAKQAAQILASVLTPGSGKTELEHALKHKFDAVLLLANANDAHSAHLIPNVEKLTKANIPIFVVRDREKSDENPFPIHYESVANAVKASAIPLMRTGKHQFVEVSEKKSVKPT